MRDKVTGARRWVVKIGSALLTADGRGISREWRFKSFRGAAALANLAAWQAEAANHHPDIAFGWGAASVTKYLVSEEHIFFFDDEDVEAVLIEVKGYDEFLSMTDKEAQEAYNALPWVECIAVDINLP